MSKKDSTRKFLITIKGSVLDPLLYVIFLLQTLSPIMPMILPVLTINEDSQIASENLYIKFTTSLAESMEN